MQYLRKEVRDAFYFLHVIKRQSFQNLALSFLMETARHARSIQNRKFVTFLQDIQKKLLQLLLCSIVTSNIQIFYGGIVVFVVAWFWMVVVKNDSRLLDCDSYHAPHLFIEHSGEHWWNHNEILLFPWPQAIWRSSASSLEHSVVTSAVLY